MKELYVCWWQLRACNKILLLFEHKIHPLVAARVTEELERTWDLEVGDDGCVTLGLHLYCVGRRAPCCLINNQRFEQLAREGFGWLGAAFYNANCAVAGIWLGEAR